MSYKWKLKIKETFGAEDGVDVEGAELSEYTNLLAKLKELRAAAHKAKGIERKAFTPLIGEIRSELSQISTSAYLVELSLGKQHKFTEVFVEYPTHEDIMSVVAEAKRELKKLSTKKHNAAVKSSPKMFLGIPYAVTGGVFTTPKSILEIKKNCDPLVRVRNSKTPHAAIKSNYVGVELEFLSMLDIGQLNNEFVAAKLEGYIHVGTDGSVRPDDGLAMQGYRGLELRILCKQEDAKDIVARTCAVLIDKAKAKVNNTCGMHVHFDMRHRDVGVAYHNLVRSLGLLSGMVPQTRTTSEEGRRYCRLNTVSDFDTALRQDNARYQAINPAAFQKLRTIEVRLHSGTVNATKIYNWIKIISTILETKVKFKGDIATPDDFNRMYDVDAALQKYMADRTALFASSQVSTTQDDKNSNYEMAV